MQGNLYLALAMRLRGTRGAPYDPDMAARTRDRWIRYPDVTIYCGRGGVSNDDAKAFDDPRIVFEVLSARPARTDLRVKLEEYRELPSIDTIVFVDIATERVRIVQRTAVQSWTDTTYQEPADVDLPVVGLTLTHAEIFARD